MRIEGRTLGDFVVREKIGEGGFGAVFRAEQPLLDRDAVIKVLRGGEDAGEHAVTRFLREARFASQLDHPYAAHIYAFGAEPDGLRWIAMELVRGTPLNRLLEAQGPLALERFAPFLARLCEVVHTAHERRIVHRDIKPANVMVLARAGRILPKLLDLGIAKLVGPGASGTTPAPAAPAPAPSDSLATAPGRRPAEGKTPIPDGETTTLGGPPAAEPVDESIHPDVLTERGAMIGSPPYMAPEQWQAAELDGRADQYALAVLSYEALTGRRPFQGRTVAELARAHCHDPPPALGDGLPPALDVVLARALAKRPEDRYATVLDFAAAFRDASGVATIDEPATPQLDETVRERMIAHAPQPLAEAVAALEAARSPHQARDALADVTRVIVRLLALYALAARTSVRRGAAVESALGDALRSLRSRELDAREWLELARELCRPLAELRAAHPLPELVSYFFPEQAIPPPCASLERLIAGRADGRARAAAEVRDLVAGTLPDLADACRAVDFLLDYALVIPSGGQAVRWMGLARARRVTAPLVADAPDGRPLLADRRGRALLPLWPLVQVDEPAPGAPHELFLFDGRGRHGARLVSLPVGYERQDPGLWEWFGKNLLDSLEQPGAEPSSGDRAPYRGLAAFSVDDADLFIGREREAQAVRNRLRVQSLVAVVGPSGAGKSSFVHAGVLPLAADVRTRTVRPGAAPRAAFAACLAEEPTWIIVDQLEELVTLCADPDEREGAAALLVEFIDARPDARLIVTLRDDFLTALERLRPFRERLARGLVLLGTPLPEDLERILVEPARRAGYDFEDRGLPEEMIAEVRERPGALALLSFTAARLWELRDRGWKKLTRNAYAAMGGVGGALAQHAEAVFAGLHSDEQRLCREAFRHLVTAEGTRAAMTRAELAEVLGGTARAQAVIDRLLAARLVTSSSEAGDRIELVHETLLAAWPRLATWQREDAEGARLRHQLRAAARQWDERGRPRGLLWRDEALAEYRLWRARHGAALTTAEAAFGDASLRDAARGRRRLAGALAGAFVLLAAGLIGMIVLNGRTRASARAAEERLIELWEEQGRQAVLGDDFARGFAYLAEVQRRGHDGPAVHYLLARASAALRARELTVAHEDQVNTAVFSGDETRILTAGNDAHARVWDAHTGQLRLELAHRGQVASAVFGPGDRTILTSGADGMARLWDAASGAELRAFGPASSALLTAIFDPTGARVLTGGRGGVEVWDATTGARLFAVKGILVAFTPSGRELVTWRTGNVATIWNAETGLARLTLTHGAPVYDVAVSPDGKLVATAGGDGVFKIWDLTTGDLLRSGAHNGEILSVVFDAAGQTLLTGSFDHTARAWDVASGRLLFTLAGHESGLRRALFLPDGKRIVTAAYDGTIRLWDARNGTPRGILGAHSDVVLTLAVSRRGDELLSASFDHTAAVWSLAGDRLLASIDAREAGVMLAAAFSPEGERVVTASQRGAVTVWDARSGARVLALAGVPKVGGVRWSPDGAQLMTSSTDGTARVWDAATGTLLRTLEIGRPLMSARFGPDGTQAVIAEDDGPARIWDLRTGARVATLGEEKAGINDAAFFPDGTRVATASFYKTATLWDVGGVRLHELTGHRADLHSIDVSANGTLVSTAGNDRFARVWDGRTGALVATTGDAPTSMSTAALDPDGALLVTGGDAVARVWDARSGRLLDRLSGHTMSVAQVAFDARGERVVTASEDGTAKIWDVRRDFGNPDETSRCYGRFRMVGDRLEAVGMSDCHPTRP